MDYHEFERKIQKINRNFKIRVTERETAADDDTKINGVFIPAGTMVIREPVFEVWDIDGQGSPYVACAFSKEELNQKMVEFVRTGDMIRKKGRQLELVRIRKAQSDARLAAHAKERKNVLESMTNDFQPIISKLADEMGVTKGSAIASIAKNDNISWDDAKKEYVRRQGNEPAR